VLGASCPTKRAAPTDSLERRKCTVAEDVVWGNTTPVLAREGREEARRCGACNQIFRRPLESDTTHRQVDEAVGCPPDAEVLPISKAGRWKRR
jgi:hypothetical protein